jgi:CNT family concentrative nucleoside transporter
LFRGATEGATLVLHLGAIIVAFVSSVSFLNSSVAFLAALVGIQGVTFEWILGYHF